MTGSLGANKVVSQSSRQPKFNSLSPAKRVIPEAMMLKVTKLARSPVYFFIKTYYLHDQLYQQNFSCRVVCILSQVPHVALNLKKKKEKRKKIEVGGERKKEIKREK